MPARSGEDTAQLAQPARLRCLRFVGVAMEAVVLALVCWSPWPFGSVHPAFEYVLHAGVTALCVLWAIRVLVEWRFTWVHCPVALCLAGLFLVGIAQVVPLQRELLRRLSPATAALHDRLLPANPEVLPGGELADQAADRAGTTLSLCPGETRETLLKLLAVFLLFAVVRNHLTSRPALRRLAIVALINGSLLSLLALFQFLTSPHSRLYWHFDLEKDQAGFGAFICRNHFPFYVNMCIGLGIGLLLHARQGPEPAVDEPERTSRRRRRRSRRSTTVYTYGERSWLDPLREWLQDPAALWISVGLALMLTSVLLSLSRGGMLSLLGAGVLCLAIQVGRSRRRAPVESGLLILVLVAAVTAWFGFDAIESRLDTVLQGEALKESRGPLWQRLLPVVKAYPIFGTGYGTFRDIEPTQHQGSEDPNLVAEHAHNDYLEALIEGGALRLTLTLVVIGTVLWLGYRAVRRQAQRPGSGLALGALFAFVTVVLHSIGDFGLHIPAIAWLVAVITAQLLGQGQEQPTEKPTAEPGSRPGVVSVSLWGLGPILAATAIVVVGLRLHDEAWRAFQAERLRLAAVDLATSDSPNREAVRINYLEHAVQLAPENAGLRIDFAEAHLRSFVARRQAVQTVVGAMAAEVANHAPDREDLLPAMRAYVVARDVNPLRSEPHVRLAALAGRFEKADSPMAYLERARLLRPTDAEILYACGRQEFDEKRLDQAWQSWHECLAISGRRLYPILDACKTRLGSQELMDKVLPADTTMLIRAADHLFPEPSDVESRKPFRERALAVLRRQADPRSAAEWYERALDYRSLDQPAEAIAAYREAMDRRPGHIPWRYELAVYLTQQKRYAEAERELRTLLARQPEHAEAQALLLQVVRARNQGN